MITRFPVAVAAIAIIALISASPAGAQEQMPSGTLFKASAQASAGTRATQLRGESALMVGGDALLRVTDGLHVGLTGWALIDHLSIPSETLGSELALDFGYGGLVIESRLGSSQGRALSLRVTLGAGNAKLRLPVVSTEIAADNFGVIEPELVGLLDLGGPFTLKAHAGYRVTFGAEDLPGIASSELRGLVGSLSLSIGPF